MQIEIRSGLVLLWKIRTHVTGVRDIGARTLDSLQRMPLRTSSKFREFGSIHIPA